MSTTVDQRVVEMRFDNQHFEKNVQTSLSTLDKLKRGLNLKGASKGLEDVGSAAKKVDMNGLGNAVDSVKVKFSALQVMGITALQNITNSAVNAGKRMVSALTVDPIKTGFQEYETKINAVQTIMANTSSKGKTLADVTKVLDELNTYADKTIYNFTEMTRNIGTFTAAGVGLEESATAIQGIANLAAVSGSNAQQASTAMYQLSQAMSAGTVKLMDWNSVVNAGMGGQVFQDALKATARAHGIAVDEMIEKNGSFRESLSEGWITTEILTETLGKMTKSGAAEYLSKLTGIEQSKIESTQKLVANTKDGTASYEELANQLASTGKITKEEAKNILTMADTAEDAATKVKTFSQLIDTLKESLQSGWTRTWELVFGDFEQAKELFTGIFDFLGGIINRTSEIRNGILEIALGSPFAKIIEKLEKVTEVTEAVAEATKDYGDIVDKVIGGEFGSGQARWDKLAESGYDWAKVQNLVNEKLGDSTRHTEQLTEAQKDSNKAQAKSIDQLVKMSDAQLRSIGFTKEEVKSFRELEKYSKLKGISIEDLMKDVDQLSGRTLLINSFKNAGKALIDIFNAAKKAWQEIFPPKSIEERAEILYGIIAAIHKFSTTLKVNEETASKITRTLKGLFAIIDIISTFTGGVLKVGLKALTKLLGMADLNILDVTASLGDMVVAFRDFLFDNDFVNKALELLVDGAVAAAKGVSSLAKAFMALPKVQGIIKRIESEFAKLKNIDLEEVGKNILEGLANGLDGGVEKIVNKMIEIGKELLASIKKVLGIHSPSTEFQEVGSNVIAGLINGLQNGVSSVVDFIKVLGYKMVDVIKNFDFGTLFALGVSGGMLVMIKKVADFVGALTKIADGVGGILESTGDVVENFAGVVDAFKGTIKSFSMGVKAKALKEIAIAIAILAASIIALSFIPAKQLWNAVGAVAVLAGVMVLLTVAVEKMAKAAESMGKTAGLGMLALTAVLIGIGSTLLILAKVVKTMSGLNLEEAKMGFLGLAGLIVALSTVFFAYGKLVKGKAAQNIGKAGKLLRSISISLLLMVGVVKLVGMLTEDELKKGGAAIAAFVTVVALLVGITNISGKGIDKLGSMMLKLSTALLLMVGVAKIIVGMTWEDMGKAAAGIAGMIAIIALLATISLINTKDCGKTLLQISASMLILIGVAKLIVGMEWDEMGKAAVGLVGLVGIVALLVKVTQIAKNDAGKIALTLLSISISIGILAAIAVMFSLIKLENLAKGVTAVGILGSVMALMIHATKGATNVKGSIMAMAVAIGVMAGAVAILSFIDPKKLAVATGAMSLLMGMFALIAKASSGIGAAMKSLIVMTVAVGILAGVLYLIAQLPIERALSASVSLSVLLLSFAASIKILNAANISPKTLVAVGLMTAVITVLAGVLYLIKDLPIESTMANVTMLSGLLLALSAACLILSAVGSFGPAAFVGIGALMTLIVAVGGLMVAIGALVDEFPKLEEFMNKGIPILEKIGHGLGSFFGNIIGGFLDGITEGLPEMATKLSDFMTKLQPFIEGSKSIDQTAIDGISSLVKMVALLGGATIVDNIASFLTGSSSIDDFGEKINKFAGYIVSFSNRVKGNIDEDAVTAAANAGRVLAELQSKLPGSGGVFQFFAGEKDLSLFGEQLVIFGAAIVNFSNKVKAGVDEEAITAAANAGSIMAELQSKIPGSGGVFQMFTGKTDLGTFGTQLVAFGEAITGFSNTVKGNVDEEAVTAAANAGRLMANVQKAIPENKWLDGKQSLADFGKDLKKFGEGIADYSDSVIGLDFEGLNRSIIAASRLVAMFKKIVGIDPKAAENFKNSLNSMARTNVSAFINTFNNATPNLTVAGSNMMAAVIEGVNSKQSAFLAAGGTLTNSLLNGINAKSPMVTTRISKLVTDMVSALRQAGDKFLDVGKFLMARLVVGLKSQTESVKKAATSTIVGASAAIKAKENYDKFYNAGSYLVSGFAKGISENTYKAAAKAKAMANAAEQAAKEALDEHSPSRVFYEIGAFAGQGMVNALNDYSKRTGEAGKEMAESAVDGLRNPMSKIADLITGDIEIQPGITPVLDLSNVRAGAKSINAMLSKSQAMSIGANIRTRKSDVEDLASVVVSGIKDAINSQNGTENAGGNYTFSIPLNLDGREVARATASYTEAELNKLQMHSNRKLGYV